MVQGVTVQDRMLCLVQGVEGRCMQGWCRGGAGAKCGAEAVPRAQGVHAVGGEVTTPASYEMAILKTVLTSATCSPPRIGALSH